MVAAETIILLILKMVFIVVAAHIGLTKLVPMLESVLKTVIKDQKSLDGLTSLLSILILTISATKVIEFGKLTEIQVLSYLDVFQPALDLFMQLVPYFAWVLGGLVVILGIRGLSK